MKKSIVIADNFRLITNKHLKLFKYINKLLESGDFEQCFILIAQEDGDFLGQYEKEHMIQKLLDHNDKFIIEHIETLKMFKDIMRINGEYEAPVVQVYVEPFQYNFIMNSLKGLPLKIIKYKDSVDVDDVEDTIIDNRFQDYCKLVPLSLHPEFENLKDIYKDKRISEEFNKSEDSMKKENKKNSDTIKLDDFITEKIDKCLTNIDNGNDTYVKADRDKIYKIAEEIILEKLFGKEFDEMHLLKKETLKNIQKVVGNKWLLEVNKVCKKLDGSFLIKLIGSGNTRLNLVWGETIKGGFAFNTSVQLNAGDEFSMGLYSFMNDAMDNIEALSLVLTETQSNIKEEAVEDVGGIDQDINTNENLIDDFSGNVGNLNDGRKRDGTGPVGLGPNTGKGLGDCNKFDNSMITPTDIDNNVPEEEHPEEEIDENPIV